MNTVDEQVKAANQSIASINESVKELGISAPTIPTLSADTLRPARSFSTASRPAPSQAAGLDGAIGAQADQFSQALVDRAAADRDRSETALDRLTAALGDQRGQESFALQAEQEFDVFQREAELNDINQRLLQERRSLQKQVDRIRENEEGGLESGMRNAIAEAERESLSKQADLSIIQLSAQGRFDSAKAMADRKAQVLFEKQQNDINNLKFVYSENKDLFSKSEDRAFNVMLSDRQNKLNQEKDAEARLSNIKLQSMRFATLNGAPTSVLQGIQEADTPEEVIRVGGRYGAGKLTPVGEKKRSTQIIDIDGRKALVDTQSGDIIRTFGAEEGPSVIKFEQESQEIQDDIFRVDELLSNTRGLKSATGALQSPLIGGFFGGGLTTGANDGIFDKALRFTPGIGNINNAIQTKNDTQDFLSGVSFMVNSATFDELMNLKAGGATFGALTEGERIAIGRAANNLSAAVEVDGSGNVTGIRASEEKATQWLNDLRLGFEEKQDLLNSQHGLNSQELAEINNISF